MSTPRKQTALSAAVSNNRATDGFSLLSTITRGFKAVGLAVAVWSWGYMGFSVAWLYVALFFHIINEEYRKIKDSKKAFAQRSLVDEKEAILSLLDEYPSWVYFPEAEKAAWFNKIMKQMWPYIGNYVEGVLRTTVQQSVRGSLPNKFQNFSFETVELGDTSPSIDNVVVYQDAELKDEIVFDVEYRYNGDAVIEVNVNGIGAGIKEISVSGRMRVIMKPLVSQVPIIGALTVFFLDKPNVDFNLTGTANFFDLPLFNTSLRGIVEEQVAHHLVLPNRFPVALVPGIDISTLKHPFPKGVIHLQIIEARDLKGADSSLIGGSRSDPYCVIQVGAKTEKTEVVKNSRSPVWNEQFELIIDQTFGQFVSIDVRDEDKVDRDDSLGKVNLSVEAVVKQQTVNVWQQLEGVPTGSVHIMATWFNLSTDIQEMTKRRIIASKTRKTFEETLSSAVLLVVLEGASEVSQSHKSDSVHNLFARITVGHNTQKSSVQYKTDKPRWDESFQFFVDDPETRPVTVELWHRGSTKEKKLGTATVPVNDVLMMDNMTAVKQLPMRDVSPTCTLTLHLTLRIMTRQITDSAVSAGVPGDLPPSNVTSNNNTDVMATPELTSRAAKIDDKGTTDVRAASVGESSAPATVGGDVTEVAQSAAVTLSAPPSPGSSHPYGQIEITIHYSEQDGHLVAVIHQCRDLIPCDKDNLADPYVRIYVMPNHSSETKRKTKLAKNTLNPVFDETFEWPMTFTEAQSGALDIAVKNDVRLFSKSRTEMGRVVLRLSDLADISKPTMAWYDLSGVE